MSRRRRQRVRVPVVTALSVILADPVLERQHHDLLGAGFRLRPRAGVRYLSNRRVRMTVTWSKLSDIGSTRIQHMLTYRLPDPA